VSKRNALRALKQERRYDVAAYMVASVPDSARLSEKARKAIKRRITNRVLVKP
jgi:Spy/CpxP family protein refolding chaperone